MSEQCRCLVVYFGCSKSGGSGFGRAPFTIQKDITVETIEAIEEDIVAGSDELDSAVVLNIIPLADKEEQDGR